MSEQLRNIDSEIERQAVCAHVRLDYSPVEVSPGCWRARWCCPECGFGCVIHPYQVTVVSSTTTGNFLLGDARELPTFRQPDADRAGEENMKPSIGRIVIYNHPGSADGKFPPKQSPALVQKVNDDGTCEMVVFSVYGGLFFNHSVKQGDGPSQWNWPARVE